MVELAVRSSSKRVLMAMMEEYKLLLHLKALKSFLLLGQGDFACQLMDAVGPILEGPAVRVYKHALSAALDSAVRSSNAEFERYEDCMLFVECMENYCVS